MEYKHGEPISTLLSEFLLKYTTEDDCVEVRKNLEETEGKNIKSLSLIVKIRRGAYPISEDTEKYANALLQTAITKKREEDTRFEPLLNKSA